LKLLHEMNSSELLAHLHERIEAIEHEVFGSSKAPTAEPEPPAAPETVSAPSSEGAGSEDPPAATAAPAA
jgi:hypothetical protein